MYQPSLPATAAAALQAAVTDRTILLPTRPEEMADAVLDEISFININRFGATR